MQSHSFWVWVDQYVRTAFNSELNPPPLCIKNKSATAVIGQQSSSALTLISVQNKVIAKQLKQPEIQNGLKLNTQYSFYEYQKKTLELH